MLVGCRDYLQSTPESKKLNDSPTNGFSSPDGNCHPIYTLVWLKPKLDEALLTALLY